MSEGKNKLYLAANKRGILLELFFGTEPPKDYNGVYIGTNACHYLTSFPHEWVREHGMKLEPGDIAVITDIKYEVIKR